MRRSFEPHIAWRYLFSKKGHNAINIVSGISAAAIAVVTAGYELMEESDFLERTMEAVRSGRKYLTDSIKSLGLRVYESDTSFILFEGPRDLGTKMLEKGILIRECSDFEGLSEGFYRICTGNEENNRRFMEILGDSIV